MKNKLIISIDGPSAVGKSTIGKLIAQSLDFLYINTGAIYRALTWKALKLKIDLEDEESLLKMISEIKMEIRHSNNKKDSSSKIIIDGKDITEEIHNPEIDQNVSNLAKLSKIRKKLISFQRNLAKSGNIVMEGRDIGSKILFNADIKLFFTASKKERAERRYRELIDKGYKIDYEEVRKQIEKRDLIDSKRKYSPLKKAKDAIVIDSTKKTIFEIKKEILDIVKKYKENGK
ncbi:MAG: (d)CMP kinase [Candidatus Caldatribacteriota bacterium]|nr:(d)CMP kinase [Candidatus Caldatribacteriota bacterium]